MEAKSPKTKNPQPEEPRALTRAHTAMETMRDFYKVRFKKSESRGGSLKLEVGRSNLTTNFAEGRGWGTESEDGRGKLEAISTKTKAQKT